MKSLIVASFMAFTLGAGALKAQEVGSCETNMFEKAAWGLSQSNSRRFLEDATLPGNRGLSDGEVHDRLLSSIKSMYKARGLSEGPFVSADSLASKIQWAAECTGHDFSMLAAVLKVESAYCSLMHNKGGGDSGCGQFTGAAIGFFKNQLRLPGRKENGSALMKKTIEEVVSRCAPGSTYVNENSLVELFSKNDSDIRTTLRAGKNISVDIMATAIYLKFYYAISGFYYNASSSQPGALSRYNGGGVKNYGEKINGHATKIDGSFCSKDPEYLRQIESAACELSGDSDVCQMRVPTFDI